MAKAHFSENENLNGINGPLVEVPTIGITPFGIVINRRIQKYIFMVIPKISIFSHKVDKCSYKESA